MPGVLLDLTKALHQDLGATRLADLYVSGNQYEMLGLCNCAIDKLIAAVENEHRVITTVMRGCDG